MKRALISLCIPFLVCVFASNSYADEATLEYWGGTYTGEVSNGVPHGQGTWIHPNGDKYVGEFKDGKPHGQGTLTIPHRGKYVGEWKDGKRNGQGTYTWLDGGKYVGEWKGSDPWNGTEYDKDGSVTAIYSEGVKTEK